MTLRTYHFYIYILASRSRDLYIGFTNNIHTRIQQHREQNPGTHTTRYNINCLVCYEHFRYVNNAINREKDSKTGPAKKKISLIESTNPTSEDLAKDW